MSVGVRARGVEKSYRDGTRRTEVLRGVDLDLEPGGLTAIVGPSGAGKSTLLHLLGGLDVADAGEIDVAGVRLDRLDATKMAQFRNRTIGFVFQFQELLPDFTALENVMMPGRIAGRELAELEWAAEELLAEVDMEERRDRFPNQLSGGERQRVALCRALILEPPLLLADEPTGNLDPESGERVFDLLIRLQERRGTTALVV
ncbi:MAG: ABC transporter ATP-binding protein, partial [Thermoanaerobaculia bacterium]